MAIEILKAAELAEKRGEKALAAHARTLAAMFEEKGLHSVIEGIVFENESAQAQTSAIKGELITPEIFDADPMAFYRMVLNALVLPEGADDMLTDTIMNAAQQFNYQVGSKLSDDFPLWKLRLPNPDLKAVKNTPDVLEIYRKVTPRVKTIYTKAVVGLNRADYKNVGMVRATDESLEEVIRAKKKSEQYFHRNTANELAISFAEVAFKSLPPQSE